jgi:hypothetical protein
MRDGGGEGAGFWTSAEHARGRLLRGGEAARLRTRVRRHASGRVPFGAGYNAYGGGGVCLGSDNNRVR